MFALLALVGTSWWLLKSPAPAAHSSMVAVLPFGNNRRETDFLAEGLWDDTRAALSQHRTVGCWGAQQLRLWPTRGHSKGLPRQVRLAYLLMEVCGTMVTDSSDSGPYPHLRRSEYLGRHIPGSPGRSAGLAGGRSAGDRRTASPAVGARRRQAARADCHLRGGYALYSEARALLRERN